MEFGKKGGQTSGVAEKRNEHLYFAGVIPGFRKPGVNCGEVNLLLCQHKNIALFLTSCDSISLAHSISDMIQ